MGKKEKKSKFSLEITPEERYQLRPIHLVADGAIAQGNLALGKLVPVLIVDTTSRPDIVDVMRAHTVQPSGDVTARWANPDGFEKEPDCLIHLILHFIRPINTYAIIKFSKKQGGLVDQILRVKLVYLQAGAPGDRLANTLEDHKILVEIRNNDFDGTWERMLFDTVFHEFRMRGLDKKQSTSAARDAISKGRQLGDIRMGRRDQKKSEE